jgi:hypothetical protein
MMPRRRVRIVIEVDLDPVPGWGDNPEDWQRLIESRMTEHWYHPVVTVDRVIPGGAS